jgi:hypothetical protein
VSGGVNAKENQNNKAAGPDAGANDSDENEEKD